MYIITTHCVILIGRREVNYLRDLLSYARNIFLTIEVLSPLNEEAAKL